MDCILNIAQQLTKEKVNRLLNNGLKEGLTKEQLVDLTIQRIKSWYSADFQSEGLSEPTSVSYEFTGAKNELLRLLDSWNEAKIKQNSTTILDGDEVAVTPDINKSLQLTNATALWREVLPEAILKLQEEVRIKNIQPPVNPIVNGAPFIDFSNISALLSNSDAMVEALNTRLSRLITSASFINTESTITSIRAFVPPMELFVKNNIALNNNMIGLKARLWANVVKAAGWSVPANQLYIKEGENWTLNKKLFEPGNTGISTYQQILSKLSSKYEDLKVKSIIDSENLSTTKTYIDMLVLLNLDNFILKKFPDIISVNPDSANTHGLPNNGDYKYSLRKASIVNTTWANDSNGENDIADYESNVFKMVSTIIPYQEFNPNIESKSRTNYGTYLNTVRINAAGAVIGSIPNTIIFNDQNGHAYNINTWFKKVAKNEVTFKDMLTAIKNDNGKDGNLALVIDFISSIYDFLYDPLKGIKVAYDIEKSKNIDNILTVVDIESILFNQMRNVSKVTYFAGERGTDKQDRVLDTLMIDTKVGEDFESVFSSLSVKWISHATTMLQHDFWKTAKLTDFIRFLSAYGDMEFSNKAIERYKKNYHGSEVFSKETMKNLKDYFGSQLKVARTNEDGSGNIDKNRAKTALTQDEWILAVKNKKELFAGLDLTELFKAKHITEAYNLVTDVRNNEGNSSPSLGVGNISWAFNSIVNDALENVVSSETRQTLESLKGFTVLWEVNTLKGARPFSKLSAEDNMSLGFLNLFYGRIFNSEEMIIQPYNFADKSKVVAQRVDYTNLTKHIPKGKVFTSYDAIDMLKVSQKEYFTSLQNHILSDYRRVFSNKFPNIQAVDDFLVGKTWKDLMKEVEKYNNNPKNALNQVEFTEELHASLYRGGLAFNKLLKNNIEIWTGANPKKLDEFIAYHENTFTKNIQATDLDVSKMRLVVGGNILTDPNKIIKLLKSKFHFTDDDFNVVYKTKNVTSVSTDEEGKEVKTVTSTQIFDKEGSPIIQSASFKITDEDGRITEPMKRYLWTRNLITAAITNIATKGTYIHPVKSQAQIAYNEDVNFENIQKEEDERTVAFFKRMVLMGGSINRFKQGGPDGIDEEWHIAAIEDPTAPTFNYSGSKDTQKSFDGGILVSPWATQQLVDALPGANLSRVMKPLGISIRDHHMSFLKCAFFGITNSMVLASMDSEYSLYDLVRKMSQISFDKNVLSAYVDGVPTGLSIDENISQYLESVYVPHNGVYTTIASIGIGEKPHEYLITYKGEESAPESKIIQNYFDLWNLFGGPLSKQKVNGELSDSEGSINAVNHIIKLQAVNGERGFKNKMIAMLVPRQAMKNGMTNTNALNRFVKGNNEDLSTMILKTEFLGIQLDASHNADESSISEVTQVLAALAENNSSPEYYNAVYNIIAKIINNSLQEFNSLGTSGKQLKQVSNIFVRNLRNSSTVNNAQSVLDNLTEELQDKIPYTDRTIFKQFISTVISNINKEFIRKKITGSGMVLNMSQGMIKVFEDIDGKTYLAQNLIKDFDALTNPNITPEDAVKLTDSNIPEFEKAQIKLQAVLNSKSQFRNTQYASINQVHPLDVVQVFDKVTKAKIGEPINLNKIEDYYQFLNTYNDESFIFEKINNKTRDLSPTKKTFSYLNLSKELFDKVLVSEVLPVGLEDLTKLGLSLVTIQEIKTNFLRPLWDQLNLEETLFENFANNYIKASVVYKNGFSLSTTKNRFAFESAYGKNDSYSNKLAKVLQIPYTNTLHLYLLAHNNRYKSAFENAEVSDQIKFELLRKYTERVAQRNWDIIDDHKTFKDYIDGDSTYFETIFKLADGTFDTLDYGLDSTNPYVNTINIFNFNHKDCENIASKIYNTQFKLQNVQYADVNEKHFQKFFRESVNRSIFKYYDVLLNNVYDNNKALQIIFAQLETTDAAEEAGTVVPGRYLINNNGDLVQSTEIPGQYNLIGKREYVATTHTGKTYKLDGAGNKTYVLTDEFKYTDIDGNTSYAIFKTLDNREIAVASKDAIGNFVENNKDYFGILDVWDSPTTKDSLYTSLIHSVSNYNLRRYLSARKKLSASFRHTSIENAKEKHKLRKEIWKAKNEYFDNISYQMLNSWKLSNWSLSSRIPAQAGQSYMSMKTVAYMHDNENSVYVSHWQLWLQGSDYDIDKLYMMTFDIKNGIFAGWSPYFDMSTLDTVHNSLSLPAPTGLTYEQANDQIELNPEQVLDLDEQFPFDKFAIITLQDRLNVLKYVNQNWDKSKHTHIKTGHPEIYKTIRNHNSFDSEEGFNNFKVWQMIKTSRNPKNQLTANTPISFGKLAEQKKPKTLNLSMYNPYAMYKQQENNSVGRDVIGIAATGIKSYFALVTYFSNYYKTGEIDPTSNAFFMREYTVGEITKPIQTIAGLNLTQKMSENLKNSLKDALLANKYEKKAEYGGGIYTEEELLDYIDNINDSDNPALKLSALLSAATDNAKELLLADINAGIDFAGVHIFLIIMGFDEINVAKYMTSPTVLKIQEYIKDSFINPQTRFGTDNLLRTLTPKDLGINVEKIKADIGGKINKENVAIINTWFKDHTELAQVFNAQQTSETTNKIGLLDAIKSTTNPNILEETLLGEVENWFNNKYADISEKPIVKGFSAKTKQAKLDALTIMRKNLLQIIPNMIPNLKLEVEYSKEDQKLINEAENLEKSIDNFTRIYFHSRELLSAGKILSVNQGVKATLEDTYSEARKITNIMSNQQSSFFKENAKIGQLDPKAFDNLIELHNALSVWDSLDEERQLALLGKINDITPVGPTVESVRVNLAIIQEILNTELGRILKPVIMQDKPYLPESYIDEVLKVITENKIISEGVDYHQFVADAEYRKVVAAYNNLIKYNFNVVDMLAHLPHFEAMTNAFQSGNLFLEENVLGYKFISEVIPILANIGTFNNELEAYSILKLIRNRGKKSASAMISADLLDKTQDTLYEIMLIDWMKNFNFSYDFTDFITSNYRNDEIQYLVDDRSEVLFDILDRANPGDALKVDLRTEYGKAKFKHFMEIYIIPKIKERLSSNGFLKEYVYKKNRGYNMRRTVKFYQNGSNFDVALSVEQGLEKLVKGTDDNYKIQATVYDGTDVVTSTPLIDLLTVYDKIINMGRFGGNRATVYFNKDRGYDTSLATDFIEYTANLETNEEFIPNLINKLQANANDSSEEKEAKQKYREALYLSLFGKYHRGVKSYVVRDPDPQGDSDGLNKKVNNDYYRLVESVDSEPIASPALMKKLRQAQIVENRIETAQGVINVKCD